MDFENLVYEIKPFLCMALGSYALFLQSPSPLLVACSFALIAVGAWILRMRLKARSKGRGLEHLFYEAQPFLYIALGVYAIVAHRSSKLAVISSLVLFFCAATILKWRTAHRK